MTILLTLLGAISGGLLGAAIGFFGFIALGMLVGADNQQGALAMGAAVGGLPLGAVIGALLGAVIVIRMRRRPKELKTTKADVVRPVSTAQDDAQTGGGSVEKQGWIALAIVVAAAAVFWTWFHWSNDPAILSDTGGKPVLMVEIKIPADNPNIQAAVTRGTDLRNEDVYHGMDGRMLKRMEGDDAILSSTHTVAYKTTDRSVELWLGQKQLLIFNLDLPRTPKEQRAFSEWRKVDHVRPNFYGDDISTPNGHNYFIRTRVVRATH